MKPLQICVYSLILAFIIIIAAAALNGIFAHFEFLLSFLVLFVIIYFLIWMFCSNNC